jgi:hypothetical protein
MARPKQQHEIDTDNFARSDTAKAMFLGWTGAILDMDATNHGKGEPGKTGG